ncbi:Siderophore iron transporter mirC, partial [Teratosphaeria destructans]
MDGETVHQQQHATLCRVVDDEADLRSPPGAASAGPPTRDTEQSPSLARTERSPLLARAEQSPLLARGHEKTPSPDRHDMQPFDHHDDPGRREFDRQSHDSGQAGVKRLEAIASTWSKEALYLAYLGIALMTCATSLESQTTTNLTVYATSSFSAHALISTVLVVQGVVLSVVKPPMSKVADVFGRVEAFGLSIGLCVAGYVQQAASHNILIQIFIADTSDLLNRALVVTLPDVPFLVNVWVGPVLAEAVLEHLTWRWGYGLWAV